MAERATSGKRTPRKPTSTARRDPAPTPAAAPGGLPTALVRGLAALTAGLTDRMAAGGVRVGKALLLSPEAAGMRRDAGRTVRELREVAGLTLDELTAAVELSDRSLLAAVEKGTATLSFELILRLSALLARNDPVPFVAKLTRSYNPALWKLLEGWGIGRIPLQLERERRFVNVFRSQDAARQLSDASFEHVLDFTRAAFEMALAAAEESQSASPKRPRPKRRS